MAARFMVHQALRAARAKDGAAVAKLALADTHLNQALVEAQTIRADAGMERREAVRLRHEAEERVATAQKREREAEQMLREAHVTAQAAARDAQREGAAWLEMEQRL